MKPTIVVDIDSRYPTNPLKMAIQHVATAFGAEPVGELVNQDEVEASIAVTDSVAKALTMLKETERTVIVIAYLSRRDGETNDAFASRYPGRVHAINYVGLSEKDEMSFVPFLTQLIAEKAKEEGNANSVG